MVSCFPEVGEWRERVSASLALTDHSSVGSILCDRYSGLRMKPRAMRGGLFEVAAC